jgi:ribosome-associated heat shock protein Hsp15
MTGAPTIEDRDWQRLDKWLWHARFLRQRSDCTRLVAAGGVRVNCQPTDKAHARLRVGDVITLPLHGRVRVIEILALAARRGPASEARRLYREIPAQGDNLAAQDAAAPRNPCEPEEKAAYPRPAPRLP